MKEQPKLPLDLSEIEKLQNERNVFHTKAVEASQLDIMALEEDSKQKHEERNKLLKAANENRDKIENSYDYSRQKADVSNASLGGYKNNSAESLLSRYNIDILDGYKPVKKAREEKEEIDKKINAYYNSTSDIDELNSKITKHLNSSIKNSTDKISDLESKIKKEKDEIEAEINKLLEKKEEQKKLETKNKAIFYGKTNTEENAIREQNSLELQISELKTKLGTVLSPDNKSNRDLTEEKQNLERAEKLLAQEEDKQNTIKKERANFPKEMDLQRCFSELREGIEGFNKKTQKEQEDFLIRINNTSPVILTATFGKPEKTLLHLASELNHKKVGIALLNSRAKFSIGAMKESLKITKTRKTPEQNKILSTHNDNLTHEKVKEATISSMRDSLSSQSNQSLATPPLSQGSKEVHVH